MIAKIEKELSPNLIIPTYEIASKALDSATPRPVCLQDFGDTPFNIVLPLNMLRPQTIGDFMTGKSLPIDQEDQIEEIDEMSSTNNEFPKVLNNEEINETSTPTNNELDEVSNIEDIDDMTSTNDEFDLTTEEIEYIFATLEAGKQIPQEGHLPMQCEELGETPNPHDIKDVFSSCLGDPFHYQHRPIVVPLNHDCKKAYFVAY